jgi:uncharacterized MAPEG superfamily protein
MIIKWTHRISQQQGTNIVSPEIQIVLWSTCLGLVHLIVTVLATVSQHGLKYVFSARDEEKLLRGVSGRWNRSFLNFSQTFPLFLASVFCAQLAGGHSWVSLLGAQLYFWGRLIYVPIYLTGLPVVRTLVWLIAFAGIVMVLLGSMH